MARSNGKPSSHVRKPDGDSTWVVDGLVLLGIGMSSGLIMASVLLNYRMGFRSADNPTDGVVYGSAAGLGDGLKAMAPFAAYWGRRHRDWLAVGAASFLFVAITAYSFTAAIGFAAEHRAAKAGRDSTAMENHADKRRERERLEAERERLGSGRSSKEVQAAVDAALKQPLEADKRTLGEISKDCSLNKPTTRVGCAAIANLRAEKAQAEERERLDVALAGLERSGPVVITADAQLDTLDDMAKMVGATGAREPIRFGLAVLMALLLELGSGVGLYVVTTPWRGRGGGGPSSPSIRDNAQIGAVARLGDVKSYVMERIEPCIDGELSVSAIFADYCRWCKLQGYSPQPAEKFNEGFADLSIEAGIPFLRRKHQRIYRGVAFALG